MTPSCARRRSSDRRSRGARGGSCRRPRPGRSSPSPSGCPTDGRRSPSGSSRSSVCSLPGRLAAEGVARVLGPVHVALAVVEIGRASCRERVCQYVYISVVGVPLKKKQNIDNKEKKNK